MSFLLDHYHHSHVMTIELGILSCSPVRNFQLNPHSGFHHNADFLKTIILKVIEEDKTAYCIQYKIFDNDLQNQVSITS